MSSASAYGTRSKFKTQEMSSGNAVRSVGVGINPSHTKLGVGQKCAFQFPNLFTYFIYSSCIKFPFSTTLHAKSSIMRIQDVGLGWGEICL